MQYSYYFPPNFVLKMLYYSFVYPYLTNSIERLANAAKVSVNPILTKRKRALKLIGCYHYLVHGNYVAYILYAMNFKFFCLFIGCIIIIGHIITVHYLLNLFTVLTINRLIIIFIYLRTTAYRNSVCVNGTFLWNNLNYALRQNNLVKDFKSMLSKLLLDRYSIQ